MEDTLRGIVAKIAETKPDFPGGAHLRDELKVDSIRGIEIVFEIERTFKIKVPEDRYNEVRTFDDMMKLVTSLVP